MPLPNEMNQNQGQPHGQPSGQAMPSPTVPKPSTLSEYVKWARKNKQDMAFTNISNQSGTFDTGAGGGAHLMPEPAQAIPDRSAAQAQPQDEDWSQYSDQWDYADKNKDAILPQLWKRLFPKKEPGGGLTPEDMKVWKAAGDKITKTLIARATWGMGKSKASQDKASTQGELTLKDRAGYIKGFMSDYDKMAADSLNPPTMSKSEFVQDSLKTLQDTLSGKPPEQPQGQPPPGAGQPGAPQIDPEEVRRRIKLLKLKHNGNEDAIRAELRAAYPGVGF